MNRYKVLTLPGWRGSGKDHWQTLWEQQNPSFQRVEQQDWENPCVDKWVRTLHAAILASEEPVVLVGHSLGCLTAAWWAYVNPKEAWRVAAALLVAPPELDTPPHPPVDIVPFGPIPLARLPFPSLLVASENDPYMSLEDSRYVAEHWGSEFVNAGPVGHINGESGLGDWPTGQVLLNYLLRWAANLQQPLRAA